MDQAIGSRNKTPILMPEQIQIGYQNVGGGNVNTHRFLERCYEKGVQIVFIGVCWINKSGNSTSTCGAYTSGTRIQEGRRVTVYWKQKLEDVIKIVMEEDRVMGIEVEGKKIFSIYEKMASTSADYL